MNAHVSRLTLTLFSMPAVLQGFMHTPAASLLQGIYGKHFGLSLAAIGTGYLISRIFDAVTDPLIGYLSDRWHQRTGSRKIFLVIGPVITAFSLWQLYRPEEGVGIVYFTSWYIAAYLGWTITEIPYRAWSVELSHDYVQRARIAAWLAAAGMIGAATFYLIPGLSVRMGWAATTDITPQTLAVAAVIIVLLMPLSNWIMVALVPAGDHDLELERPRDSWRDVLTSIIRNGPLIRVILIYMIVGIAGGVPVGVAFFFIDDYLGLGKNYALIALLGLPISALSAPFWGWACGRFEKHRAMAVALIVVGLFYAAKGFLVPGPNALAIMIVLNSIIYFFIGAMMVAIPAMIGDAVDYGTLHFGHERAGLYFSMYAMLVKLVGAFGAAVGLFVTDFFGYNPAAGAVNDATGYFGLRAAYAWVPGMLIAIAGPLLLTHPLTRAKHAEILSKLRARAAAIP